jgi:phage baseplate assembly protein W
MAYYVGFSTQHVNQSRDVNLPTGVTENMGLRRPMAPASNKFRLTDNDLVKRDLLNAFNIPQGSKPGRPEYGTAIYNMIYEPNTADVQAQVEYEVRRIIEQDPRVAVNRVAINSSSGDNVIIVEAEIAIRPQNMVEILKIQFDEKSSTAIML